MIQVCLDALHNILRQTKEENLERVLLEIEECGGVDKIETLQTHANREIYHLSYQILDKYFSNDTVSLQSKSTRESAHSFVLGGRSRDLSHRSIVELIDFQ